MWQDFNVFWFIMYSIVGWSLKWHITWNNIESAETLKFKKWNETPNSSIRADIDMLIWGTCYWK